MLFINYWIPNVLAKMHRCTSTDSKTFAVVVSLVEYIQKEQVINPKKLNCGIS